jgi:hypothetical protein
MANVASASPGKLKESVHSKAAPTPVALSKPATAAAAVAVSRPANPAASKSAASSDEERASALAFLGNLATEVSKGTVNLPCFPDVVMRIRKALSEPDVSLTEIVKIVGTEPRLAARLLQAANSAAFNPAGKHLTDLRAAITRLGHRPVQSAAMSFAVKQLRLAPALRAISKPAECFVGTEYFSRSDLPGYRAAHAGESGGGIPDRLAPRHRPPLHHGSISRQVG